jgi:NAD(P)-dependent dehydrogenase (short-subunit alcohol dehydrogenase family)
LRAAVVTGAGRGFGRAIALRLAARGYAVLVTDIDEQAAAQTAGDIGGSARSRRLDVRNPADHREAAEIARELGPVAVWVNNAGVLRTEPVWVHSDDDVRLGVEVNVLGVMHGSRAAVDVMRRDAVQDGHIINMASVAAFAAAPGFALYAATKHAVLGWTASLEGDLRTARLPIKAHVVCPDAADTAMVRERASDPEAAPLWTMPLLEADTVAEKVVSLVDDGKLVTLIPRSRTTLLRVLSPYPSASLALMPLMRWIGDRRRPVPPSTTRPVTPGTSESRTEEPTARVG